MDLWEVTEPYSPLSFIVSQEPAGACLEILGQPSAEFFLGLVLGLHAV